MNRQTRRFIANYILRPPLEVLGFIARTLYWLLYGWWGEKRSLKKSQERLAQEVFRQFSFLLTEHNAKIIPNEDTGRAALKGWPFITVDAEGLLLLFVRWRDEQHVQVTADCRSRDWQALPQVLNIIEPEICPRYIIHFGQAAQLLKSHFGSIKAAFSPERYPEFKDQLHAEHRREMASAQQVASEINRQLYPER